MVWGVVGVLAVSGCSGPSAGHSPVAVSNSSVVGAATVEAERRSITSVVVVDGVVTASPEFVVQAPASGEVRYGTSVRGASGTGTGDRSVASGAELGVVAGKPLRAPAPGQIEAILVPDGARVAAKVPLISLRYSGFGVVTTVPVEDQYRLYDGALSAKVNITGGPSGLECQIVATTTHGQATSTDEGTSGVPVACLLPMDAPVVAGLTTKVGLATGHRENVVALPLQAVAGRVEQGEVTRVDPDGRQTQVTVSLGLTDGSYIEITGGLAVGDAVLAHAPSVGG